jgi:hypothetical protein
VLISSCLDDQGKRPPSDAPTGNGMIVGSNRQNDKASSLVYMFCTNRLRFLRT